MTTWANRTKAALTTVDVSNLKPVGKGASEAITKYYRFTTPKTPHAKVVTMKENDQLIGTFVETREYQNKFDEEKKDINHILRTETGELVSLAGAGQLNYRMGQVNPGSTVAVTYLGKKIMAKGKRAGKPAHEFLVMADNQKTV